MITPSIQKRVKIQEDKRKLDDDKSLLALKNFSDQTHAQRMNALINVKEYSVLYLRTMFLLNGGAIVALLSFIGTAISRSDKILADNIVNFVHDLRPAFVCFAYGVVCCGVTSFFAFINWYATANRIPEPIELYKITLQNSYVIPHKNIPLHINTMIWLGRLLGVISLIFFAVGAALVASAFGTFEASVPVHISSDAQSKCG